MSLRENLSAAPRRRFKSLAQEVMDDLVAQIAKGALKKGDKLPTESELMRLQGVSRTVIREAISKMQAAGIVETRHGIGSFVLETKAPNNFRIDPKDLVTIHDILNVLQLRQSLESAAAGIAAQQRSSQDLEALESILLEFRQLLDQEKDTVDADYRFHLAIAHATGNRYFVDFMSYLGQTVIPRTRINTATLGHETQLRYLERVHDEHEAIVNAIRVRDTQKASDAMQTHLNNSAERLRSTLAS
jgi:GntR family transcriptional repressor for pyruvate dehydrogenase complex